MPNNVDGFMPLNFESDTVKMWQHYISAGVKSSYRLSFPIAWLRYRCVPCSGGPVATREGLPYHLRYEGKAGHIRTSRLLAFSVADGIWLLCEHLH